MRSSSRHSSEDGSLSAGQENRLEQNSASIQKLEGELAEIARTINEAMGGKKVEAAAAKKRVAAEMAEEEDDFYDRTSRSNESGAKKEGGESEKDLRKRRRSYFEKIEQNADERKTLETRKRKLAEEMTIAELDEDDIEVYVKKEQVRASCIAHPVIAHHPTHLSTLAAHRRLKRWKSLSRSWKRMTKSNWRR